MEQFLGGLQILLNWQNFLIQLDYQRKKKDQSKKFKIS